MRKLVFLLFLAPLAVYSQKIVNTKAEALGEKIVITYDLAEGEPGDNYTVTLFASHNNFIAPLSKVVGDVGPGIKQGKGKRIEWESKAELAKYKGPLTFEIEVKVIAPFALKTSLTAARRGKSLPLKWRGGDQDQTVRIELLKAGVVEGTLGTIENKGFYEWNVAAKQRPGKDYSLRLVNGKETVNSQTFAIQHKVPIWVKALPVVAIGVGVVLLIPKPCKDCGSPTNDKLVGPPPILD